MMGLSSLFCVGLFKAVVKFPLSRSSKHLHRRSSRNVIHCSPVSAGARECTPIGFRAESSFLSPAFCPTSQPGETELPLDRVIKGLCLLVLLSSLPLSCHLACQLTHHTFIHSLNRPLLWAVIPWEPRTAVKKKGKLPALMQCTYQHIHFQGS